MEQATDKKEATSDQKKLVSGLKDKLKSRFFGRNSQDKAQDEKPATEAASSANGSCTEAAENKPAKGLKDKLKDRFFSRKGKDSPQDKDHEEKPAEEATVIPPAGDAGGSAAAAEEVEEKVAEESQPKEELPQEEYFQEEKPVEDKPENEQPQEEETPQEHHGLFQGLAKVAPLSLLIILAMVCWMPLLTTDLLCPAEADNARVLLAGQGLSLLPHAGSHVLMPVYGWLGSALASIPLASPVQFLPLAGFAGAAVCLIGLCILAAALKMGRQVMFGAGLLLFCLPIFLGMANFVGPIPFACGISMIAMALLCRAWMKESDLVCMVLGNVLAVCATLSGGLYYGLVPVVTGFIFALWRGDIARLRKKDALAGFIVFVALHLLWLGALILFGDKAITSDMVLASLIGVPYAAVFCDSITRIVLCFLPFLLILLAVSWPKIFRNLAKDIKASRKENGSAYLWIALVLSFVFSCFAAHAFDIFLTLCLLALLTARALLKLSVFGVRSFFILTGVLLLGTTLGLLALLVPFFNELAVGICPQFAALVPAEVHADLERLWAGHTLISLLIALMPLLSALVITHVAWRSRTAAAPLLTSIACIVVLAQPIGLYCMPQLATQMASAKLTDANALLSAKNDTAAEALTAPAEAKPEEVKPADTAAPAEEAKPEEAKPAESAAPAEEAKPEEAKPAETTAPAEEAKPEEAKPAESAAPAEETKPEEAKPAESAAPAEEAKPEEAKPAEPAAPAEEAKPEEAKPAEVAAPAEEAKPAESAAPAEEAKPAEAAAPAEEAKSDGAKPAEDNREAGTI